MTSENSKILQNYSFSNILLLEDSKERGINIQGAPAKKHFPSLQHEAWGYPQLVLEILTLFKKNTRKYLKFTY